MRLFTNILLAITLLIGWSGCQAETSKQVKKIYIAPDLGTYLYAISMWDTDTIFPVFMDKDDRYTKKFADAYADGGNIEYVEMPKHKVGRISKGLAYKTLYAAWGPETLDDLKKKKISREDIKQRLAELNHTPEGIVITNVKDAEFAGAIALAAGHKQIMDFYDPQFKFNYYPKKSKKPISWNEKENIRNDIINLIEGWGFPYKGLDDGIDFITLALDMTYTYNPLDPSRKHNQFYSLDDAINRIKPDGDPDLYQVPGTVRTVRFKNVYAYTGRLLEASEHMALYQGMCPLFLPIRNALFYDHWKKEWRMDGKAGAEILKKKITTLSKTHHWEETIGDFNKFDFIRLNASGTAHIWSGKNADSIKESVPCVVFFAQSGSSRYPGDTDTLCGRWLLNGAYIYYGAISEPYAHAFNSPAAIAWGIVNGFPLGKAFQLKESLHPQMTKPWKLIFIGDPMKRVPGK